jgi:myo-inositol-1(or 4)-monophosphatase
MPPILSDLETLARQAGEILRAGYGGSQQITHKGAIDLVTEIDHQSEDFIVGQIRRLFPEDAIVTEESGALSGNACCKWYIDPLDGTVNYAHGVPVFAVSIAYAQDGIVQLGVIYDPMLDECFSAERGKGAWRNDLPIHVSPANELDQSLLVTGFPYDIRTNPENNLEHYKAFSLRSQGVRRFGSAALDLCYVASGRLDGYWEIRLSSWDIAAGALIAQEAGAIVTDVIGQPSHLDPPCSVVAANPHIHAQMMQVLRR